MHCSSCEPLLDRYLEGTLTPRQMGRVREHVNRCAHCASLLTELRVVDALLATTRPVELAPNFTFAVMAETRATPMHAAPRFPLWGALSAYIVAAWLLAMAGYVAFGAHGAYLGILRGSMNWLFVQAQTTIAAVSHSFGPSTPLLVGGVITVLLVDALLAIGALYLYRAARARRYRSEAL
jgi:anti-sigma factor RsiW